MRLHVIAPQPHDWFLLGDSDTSPPDDDLYLDVNCSRGPVGYSVLVKLTPDERTAYREMDRPYIQDLATRIGSWPDRFRDRDLSRTLGRDVHNAVRAFRMG